jgi:hypothetical protein
LSLVRDFFFSCSAAASSSSSSTACGSIGSLSMTAFKCCVSSFSRSGRLTMAGSWRSSFRKMSCAKRIAASVVANGMSFISSGSSVSMTSSATSSKRRLSSRSPGAVAV